VSSRRARPSASQRRSRSEPEILSARRPTTSASGPPPEPGPSGNTASESSPPPESLAEERPRASRSARIVSAKESDLDARLVERERLLGRLLSCEGRGAITRAADVYLKAGFDFPVEQPVQLQLLEHHDETLVRSAIDCLRGIVSSEPPFKRPIFEQRLRRLEDSADEEATRVAASELRRVLRG